MDNEVNTITIYFGIIQFFQFSIKQLLKIVIGNACNFRPIHLIIFVNILLKA